jgi:hypothetical protein
MSETRRAPAPTKIDPIAIAMKLLSLIKRIAPAKCPTHRTHDPNCLWCQTREEIERAETIQAYLAKEGQ